MSLHARRALLKQFAPQYRKASYKCKQLLLDAFAQAMGYHRRSGMWLLNHAEEISMRPRSQRTPRYGPEEEKEHIMAEYHPFKWRRSSSA